jgi:hypothetical protein
VIAVRVRKDGGVDARARRANLGQPSRKLPRPKAGVDQESEAVRFQQAGVAGAAAAEHGES